MMTLRCTRKLLDRAGVSGTANTAPPSTVLGDWYANLIFTRREQLVLCMNERTLLAVVLPASDFRNVAPRFRAQVVSLLRRIGIPAPAVAAEETAMSAFEFGPTDNRKVLGCLNQAAMVLSYGLANPRFSSIAKIEDYLGDYSYSPTGYRQPRELAQELFAVSGVGPGASVSRIR